MAVYLFGSFATGDERADSDVDIALLLPHKSSVTTVQLAMSDGRYELEQLVGRQVDLLNLRMVSTVFQKEIIMTGRVLFCCDRFVLDEFEMLTLSFYQKLNEERAGILAEIERTGVIIA